MLENNGRRQIKNKHYKN